ncbi:MAG: hypothetical protein EBU84_11505, partial [Actinobacteria bacterium]|nr:hypothetical protein [Actinomycetota bacterium]
MTELVNQGAYGCLYYPGMHCNGNTMDDLRYATKLVVQDEVAANEVAVGNAVKNIVNYSVNFVPVTGTCVVNLGKVRRNNPYELDKCDVVKRHVQDNTVTQAQAQAQAHTEFKVLKQLYVPSVTLLDFVTRRGIYMDASQLHNLPKENVKKIGAVRYSVPQFMNVLISSYEYLLVGVARMQTELELVHYDLKVQNVVLNAYTKKPIIIDFGLAF